MNRDKIDRNRPLHELAVLPEYRWMLRVLGTKQREDLIRQSMEAYDEKIAKIFREHSGELNEKNGAN